MRVLVLAPHPYYQERGTPIAVDLLVRALSQHGDEVDVLTYHEGKDKKYDNVKIYRIKPFIHVRGIPPGFSLKKIMCDLHMFFSFISLMRSRHYDIVHAIEEASFMALVVCSITSTPFIYDMDSCMATQIVDKFPLLKPFRKIMDYIESMPMRHAAAVIPVCDALANQVLKYRDDNIVILKDVSLLGEESPHERKLDLRDELKLSGKIAMYIGNLESYQGIDLMLESFAIARQQNKDISLVIIGGNEVDIEKNLKLAASLGIENEVYFLGRRPMGHIGWYMSQANVLISPRKFGVNTPMKIYSYLHSGTAVLATALPTHTQIMTNEMAMLSKPDKQSFASGLITLMASPTLCDQLAKKASEFIEREHSYHVFKDKLCALYDSLEKESGGHFQDAQ